MAFGFSRTAVSNQGGRDSKLFSDSKHAQKGAHVSVNTSDLLGGKDQSLAYYTICRSFKLLAATSTAIASHLPFDLRATEAAAATCLARGGVGNEVVVINAVQDRRKILCHQEVLKTGSRWTKAWADEGLDCCPST